MKNELAIFGGLKSIKAPHPHWLWPPKSESSIEAIAEYLNNPEQNESDYPKIVEKFEKKFANLHNRKYALTANTGTSSLFAAFSALELNYGDEIIAPSLTFHATATPIFQTKAKPILCDCETDTGNIDPKEIRKKITKNTKAVVITHLWGHPCEMDEILDIVRNNSIYLIEDCSHAHGSTYKGKKVGTFGDIACFSMANTKILATGESGVLITDNRELFEKALLASDLGGRRLVHEITIDKYKKYNETGLGHNHRIHPLAAVIANEELNNLNKYIKLRLEKLNYFSKGLVPVPGIIPPPTRNYVSRGSYFGYRPFYNNVELNKLNIKDFIKIMNAEGMEVRQSGNRPLHQLPLFNATNLEKGDFPNSDNFYNSSLSLPTFTLEDFSLIDEYILAFTKVCNILSKCKIDLK